MSDFDARIRGEAESLRVLVEDFGRAAYAGEWKDALEFAESIRDRAMDVAVALVRPDGHQPTDFTSADEEGR